LLLLIRMQEPSESVDADITSKVNKAINTPMGESTQHGTSRGMAQYKAQHAARSFMESVDISRLFMCQNMDVLCSCQAL
jgi:hypothetical protein